MAKKTTTSKRVVKVEAYGEAHISSTFNNVIVSLTNAQGQVISWSSAGKCGFRGSKKNTPYAAQMAAEDAAKTAFDAGLRRVKCYVKGRVQVVSLPSAPSTTQVSWLQKSSTSPLCRTTDADLKAVVKFNHLKQDYYGKIYRSQHQNRP